MKALGRPDLMLRWSIGITAATVVGLVVGANWGVTGVAVAFAASHIVALPFILGIVDGISEYGPLEHLGASRRALVGGVVASAALIPVSSAPPWVAALASTLLVAGLFGWLLLTEPAVRAWALAMGARGH
jgi:hypothetical protein